MPFQLSAFSFRQTNLMYHLMQSCERKIFLIYAYHNDESSNTIKPNSYGQRCTVPPVRARERQIRA